MSRISLSMSVASLRALRACAKKADRPVSSMLRVIIDEYLTHNAVQEQPASALPTLAHVPPAPFVPPPPFVPLSDDPWDQAPVDD